MTVVATDGNGVEPVEVDRLIIAVSETYDVIITIPHVEPGAAPIAYEFLATSEDRTKSASLYLGEGVRQLASPLPRLKYFEGLKMMNGMMKMDGNLDDMGFGLGLTLNYSPFLKNTLPPSGDTRNAESGGQEAGLLPAYYPTETTRWASTDRVFNSIFFTSLCFPSIRTTL